MVASFEENKRNCEVKLISTQVFAPFAEIFMITLQLLAKNVRKRIKSFCNFALSMRKLIKDVRNGIKNGGCGRVFEWNLVASFDENKRNCGVKLISPQVFASFSEIFMITLQLLAKNMRKIIKFLCNFVLYMRKLIKGVRNGIKNGVCGRVFEWNLVASFDENKRNCGVKLISPQVFASFSEIFMITLQLLAKNVRKIIKSFCNFALSMRKLIKDVRNGIKNGGCGRVFEWNLVASFDENKRNCGVKLISPQVFASFSEIFMITLQLLAKNMLKIIKFLCNFALYLRKLIKDVRNGIKNGGLEMVFAWNLVASFEQSKRNCEVKLISPQAVASFSEIFTITLQLLAKNMLKKIKFLCNFALYLRKLIKDVRNGIKNGGLEMVFAWNLVASFDENKRNCGVKLISTQAFAPFSEIFVITLQLLAKNVLKRIKSFCNFALYLRKLIKNVRNGIENGGCGRVFAWNLVASFEENKRNFAVKLISPQVFASFSEIFMITLQLLAKNVRKIIKSFCNFALSMRKLIKDVRNGIENGGCGRVFMRNLVASFEQSKRNCEVKLISPQAFAPFAQIFVINLQLLAKNARKKTKFCCNFALYLRKLIKNVRNGIENGGCGRVFMRNLKKLTEIFTMSWQLTKKDLLSIITNSHNYIIDSNNYIFTVKCAIMTAIYYISTI